MNLACECFPQLPKIKSSLKQPQLSTKCNSVKQTHHFFFRHACIMTTSTRSQDITSIYDLNQSNVFLDIFFKNLLQQGKAEGFDSCDRPSNLKLDSNRQFFRPCDREIWWMTSKNNRTPLLCYCKLCASFRSHWWIQTGVTVRKCPIWVKFDDF